MRKLSLHDFKQLTEKAVVLAEDVYGKKVIELPDHSIIKLFRVKRFFSQATLYSPARRFAKNAAKLKKLNIPTIFLLDLYKINSIKRTAVHYKQLEGITVREYLQSKPVKDTFLSRLGEFIAQLHNKGVYFRSAHFGNIIISPNNQFGLIDISDMTISHFSLSAYKRLRNMKHFFRLKEDIRLIYNSTIIETAYLSAYKANTPHFRAKFLKICTELKKNK